MTSDNISSGATWTDDGRILFARTPGGDKVPGEFAKPRLATEIWIMVANGTNATRLTELAVELPDTVDMRYPDPMALQPTP